VRDVVTAPAAVRRALPERGGVAASGWCLAPASNVRGHLKKPAPRSRGSGRRASP